MVIYLNSNMTNQRRIEMCHLGWMRVHVVNLLYCRMWPVWQVDTPLHDDITSCSSTWLTVDNVILALVALIQLCGAFVNIQYKHGSFLVFLP